MNHTSNAGIATRLDTNLPASLTSIRNAHRLNSAGSRLSPEDRLAVQETVLLSEWATDARRWDVLADCLADDMVLDHALGQAHGKQAFIDVLSQPGVLDGLRHLVLNLVVWGNPNGTATALHYVGLTKFAAADTADADPLPRLDGLGLAELTLRKEPDGVWRIMLFHNDQYAMSSRYLPDADERARWAAARSTSSGGN